MSSFALKLIAAAVMLLDHAGTAFMPLLTPSVYWTFRAVGRLAMPLFCFMLAEGLFYTKNVRRYLGRLLVFAFISELPFDLLTAGKLWAPGSQNVFFTLFLGLLAITLYDRFALQDRRAEALLSLLGCGFAAYALSSDYSIFGVYFVFAFYFGRGSRALTASVFSAGVLLLAASTYLGGSPTFAFVTLAEIAALPFIFACNGTPGRASSPALRRAFYIFYPAHLLALAAARAIAEGMAVGS
jgi:hypothetical protein